MNVATRVFSRVMAAIVGGFGFASMVVIALPLLVPASKVEVVMWSTSAGFLLWTGAVIWVFAARSAMRAWIGLMAATAIASLPLLVARVVGS